MTKITEKIKSFEDALQALGKTEQEVLPQGDFYNKEAVVGFIKTMIVTEALNEEWTPDWSDSNEYKYYPWFDMRSSGGGFSFRGYVDAYSCSFVGSRLCFKSSELANYAGEQFKDLYKTWMVLPEK